MDITVERNAFGPQIASFETDISVPVLEMFNGGGTIYHAIFIRAPLIESVEESVEGDTKILTQLPDGRIVAAQQGHFLATCFHPELTDDDRFHRYFLSLIE
jgi:5'-phosphate synthase pdxT subunit